MKIFVGSDHHGFELKSKLLRYLQELGHDAVDVGDERLDPDDDFPVFATRAVQKVLEYDARAVLICGSGQGMAMAANRHRGIRAGLGWSVQAAKSLRNDEDSNILALPADILRRDQDWQAIVSAWLVTPFAAAPRYTRRNRQLDDL